MKERSCLSEKRCPLKHRTISTESWKQAAQERRVTETTNGERRRRDETGGEREGSSPSYRLMVCSRIGLVDRRLNWVSVQSPANTSSTAGPRLAKSPRNV